MTVTGAGWPGGTGVIMATLGTHGWAAMAGAGTPAGAADGKPSSLNFGPWPALASSGAAGGAGGAIPAVGGNSATGGCGVLGRAAGAAVTAAALGAAGAEETAAIAGAGRFCANTTRGPE